VCSGSETGKAYLRDKRDYVISCAGNLTGKKSLCKYVWISRRSMNTGRMLQIESSDFLIITDLRWRNILPTTDGI
jgi:hypothetical protein